MRSDINSGVMAGLIGGVVFGIMMQMMNAPTPDGAQMPMMGMVAKVVRSASIAVGWLYHLFNSAPSAPSLVGSWAVTPGRLAQA